MIAGVFFSSPNSLSKGMDNMEPKIVQLDAFSVAGFQTFGNPMNGTFGKMWSILFESGIKIENHTNSEFSYGIESYTEEFDTEKKWFYLAGVEVSSLEKIPTAMSGKVIPANTYAVFEYKGKISSKLGELFGYIYGEWLPKSGYVIAGSYDFECYGKEFK